MEIQPGNNNVKNYHNTLPELEVPLFATMGSSKLRSLMMVRVWHSRMEVMGKCLQRWGPARALNSPLPV